MGKAIPYDFRKKIIAERKAGKPFSKIASSLGYSLSGVKKIWYTYKEQGVLSLYPDYSACGGHNEYREQTRERVNALKTGDQGAPYVYSMFKKKYPGEQAPSIRTIQRWWEIKQVSRMRGRPPEKEKKIGRTSR